MGHRVTVDVPHIRLDRVTVIVRAVSYPATCTGHVLPGSCLTANNVLAELHVYALLSKLLIVVRTCFTSTNGRRTSLFGELLRPEHVSGA